MNEKLIVFEDEVLTIYLDENGINLGQLLIVPKVSVNFLDIPENVFSYAMLVANYCSTVVFESMQAHGTNIITDYSDEFIIKVIPRFNTDDFNFEWTPLRFSEEEFLEIQNKIKDETFYIGKEKPKEKAFIEESTVEEIQTEEDDPFSQSLLRIP